MSEETLNFEENYDQNIDQINLTELNSEHEEDLIEGSIHSTDNLEKCNVVKIRGLPWSASFTDIEKFFEGIAILDGIKGVIFNNAKDGRPSGEAFIQFANNEDYVKALGLNRQYMESRYIEVFEADLDDFNYFKERAGLDDKIVRLRGLPYSCTIDQIANFFEGLDIVDDGISIPKDEEGRSNEAFVQFNDDISFEAGLRKHKEKMGHRYIEVFYSNLKERSYAFGENREEKPLSPSIRPLMSLNPIPSTFDEYPNMMLNDMIKMINMSSMTPIEKEKMLEMVNCMQGPGPSMGNPSKSHMMWMNNMMAMMGGSPGMYGGGPSGYKKYWVRLRGLPFTTDEDDVYRFFKPYIPVAVRIEKDHKGKSTGEGYAEFSTYEIAKNAIKDRNKKNIGHRYIELFYESPDEDERPLPVRGGKKRGYDHDSSGYNHLSAYSPGNNRFPSFNGSGHRGRGRMSGGPPDRGHKRMGGGDFRSHDPPDFNGNLSSSTNSPYQIKKRGLPNNMMNHSMAGMINNSGMPSGSYTYGGGGELNNSNPPSYMNYDGSGSMGNSFPNNNQMFMPSGQNDSMGMPGMSLPPAPPTVYYPNMTF